MTTKMGVRDIVRNFSLLENYDYVEIEDKKTKEPKGMFISAKLAKELKEVIELKANEQKEEKISKIMQFAGTFEIDDRFKDKSVKEIREIRAKEKYNYE